MSTREEAAGDADRRIVILGAGHAGGQAVASLRQQGYDGELLLVGDESSLPYHRPMLSKQYLADGAAAEKLLIRPQKFYQTHDVDLRLGQSIASLDLAARSLVAASGERIGYDRLLLCTGSRPRQLPMPGSALAGVHYLRGLADVDRMRTAFQSGQRLVIIGGGYIGLEVAAVAREAGLTVTVLEVAERLLQRVATPAMSDFYQQLHERHGVDVRTSVRPEAILGESRVQAVQLADGSELPADLVLIGVGVLPNVELAAEAGLKCDNGILVDEHCRTSDPAVYAAGDCTSQYSALAGQRVRLECVSNAMDQAKVAAANLCGVPTRHDSVPWFWSDQYDVKLQMVGFSGSGDQQVTRGAFGSDDFMVFYLTKGRVTAVDLINCPRALGACKQLVTQRKQLDPELLADPGQALSELVKG